MNSKDDKLPKITRAVMLNGKGRHVPGILLPSGKFISNSTICTIFEDLIRDFSEDGSVDDNWPTIEEYIAGGVYGGEATVDHNVVSSQQDRDHILEILKQPAIEASRKLSLYYDKVLSSILEVKFPTVIPQSPNNIEVHCPFCDEIISSLIMQEWGTEQGTHEYLISISPGAPDPSRISELSLTEIESSIDTDFELDQTLYICPKCDHTLTGSQHYAINFLAGKLKPDELLEMALEEHDSELAKRIAKKYHLKVTGNR